ncbi:MAG: SCO family protein [Pseudomonadota bacterium]
MRVWGVLLAVLAGPVLAHDGVIHKTPEEAQAHAAAELPAPSGLPFPVKLGGPFELTDHTGAQRSAADPDGRMQLLFFGYANCEAICSVALPLMAETTDQLKAAGLDVRPVMVTVDPERDTVEAMGPALARHHADFVGLTGTEPELNAVYDLFAVEKSVVFEDPIAGPIYAHGSHIYLLNGDGEFLTLLPPILSTERVSEIVAAYAKP